MDCLAVMNTGVKKVEAATVMGYGRTLSVLAVICAKQAFHSLKEFFSKFNQYLPSKSVLLESPKQLLTTIRIKGAPILLKVRSRFAKKEAAKVEKGGGLWQRNILMGEKCDPLNFSGAIFYDSNGNRLFEPQPKSPRIVVVYI